MFKSFVGSKKFLPYKRLNTDQVEPVARKNHGTGWRDIQIFTDKISEKISALSAFIRRIEQFVGPSNQ